MVAFCDIIEERAQKANVEYAAGKGKVFTDYKKLLKEDLDAVCVCTPNVSHSEITVAAVSYTHLDVYKRQALCDAQRVGLDQRKYFSAL